MLHLSRSILLADLVLHPMGPGLCLDNDMQQHAEAWLVPDQKRIDQKPALRARPPLSRTSRSLSKQYSA